MLCLRVEPEIVLFDFSQIYKVFSVFRNQKEQFHVHNTKKTRKSTNNLMPFYGLNNEIIVHSHKNQPLTPEPVYYVPEKIHTSSFLLVKYILTITFNLIDSNNLS